MVKRPSYVSSTCDGKGGSAVTATDVLSGAISISAFLKRRRKRPHWSRRAPMKPVARPINMLTTENTSSFDRNDVVDASTVVRMSWGCDATDDAGTRQMQNRCCTPGTNSLMRFGCPRRSPKHQGYKHDIHSLAERQCRSPQACSKP
jgi:hypothetical protein